jgi:O-succinylbenzoic acid--CoA ligase
MLRINNNNHWLKKQAKKNPGKIALEKAGEKLSFLQLYDISKATAIFLHENGIRENDNIAILSGNSVEFVIVVNALWLLGSVPVPINIRLKQKEINNLISHSGSVAVLNLGTDIDSAGLKCEIKIDFNFDEITHQKKIKEIEFRKNKTALLMYSSGSTGMPKCVEHTFENLFYSVKSFLSYTQSTKDDIWLASLPFYHIGGFSVLTRSLLIGNCVVIPQSFSATGLKKTFDKNKPAYFSVVPTMMKRLLEKRIKPWKELKNVFIGGGPVSEKLINECLQNKWPVVKVYGSTETASMVTAISGKELTKKPSSAGKPLLNVTVKIIDEVGKELPVKKKGEIVIYAKSVAKGYFNSESNNIKKKKYFTNDLGSLDENGFLYVYGRKDDIIISGGENFNLNEIEEYVKTLDIIEDCATLKVIDDTWGESYILIVAANVKSKKLKENILNELKTNIAKYKHPQKIVFVNKIPRNELGKLNIDLLKKIIKANTKHGYI